MIHTFVIFRVRPGNTDDFEAIHRRLLAHMSKMAGCVDVDVYRSAAEPVEYMVHGRWESQTAWERAHQTNPEFRNLFAQLPIQEHSLSRASFFDPAYSFEGCQPSAVENSVA